MNSGTTKYVGPSFYTLLGVLFIGLKLTKHRFLSNCGDNAGNPRL